jgi:hypothetical protein
VVVGVEDVWGVMVVLAVVRDSGRASCNCRTSSHLRYRRRHHRERLRHHLLTMFPAEADDAGSGAADVHRDMPVIVMQKQQTTKRNEWRKKKTRRDATKRNENVPHGWPHSPMHVDVRHFARPSVTNTQPKRGAERKQV